MAAPMTGIYKIMSPSGKIYVGQSVDIQTRFAKYRLLHCRGQVRLYASFLRYGVSGHSFEVLEICNVNELDTKERYYQDIFDSVGTNGLNCKATKCPGRSGYHSIATRENISKGKMGKKCSEAHIASLKRAKSAISEETKKKIRQANLGKKASAEWIETMRKKNTGNKYTLGIIPVNARKIIDTTTGFVYESVTVAARINNINPRTLRAMLDGQNPNKTTLKFV